MAISNKLTTVASGVKNIRTALKEIDSNFGAGHISTLDDEIRQIGSNGTLVLYKDSEGNYRTKLCTSVNSIKSSVSGDIIAIILPESAQEIGRDSLSSLTSLEFINLQNVTYFNALSFSGNTITIDASQDLRNVEWIAGSAFSGSTGLVGELNLPKLKGFAYKNDTLTHEANQFRNCTGITDIVNLGTLTSINNSSFGGCTGLTDVTIPNSVTNIDQQAFVSCTNLKSITIPNVSTMGNGVFSECWNLEQVELGDVTSINGSIFGARGYTSRKIHTLIIHGCSSLSITQANGMLGSPSTLKYIYVDCVKKFVDLSSNLYWQLLSVPFFNTDGGGYVYVNGQDLGNAVIPNDCTTIGVGAFNRVNNVTSVDVGSGVTKIGRIALRNDNITHVIFRGTTPPELYQFHTGYPPFTSSVKIYVPYGYGNTYKTATDWTNYASQIYELNQNGTIPA